MNLLASADTLPAAGGTSAPLAFIYDLFSNPLFIFIGGLVLLGVFFWYLGSDQDRVKRNAGTIFIIGIASFSLFSLFQQGLKYGIDIAGGVSFTLSVEPNIGDDGKPIPLTDQAMEQACVILTERLNSTGANDVIIRPKKKDNLNLIEVQIPAADPAKREETKAILTKVAKLQILPVHPRNNELVAEGRIRVPGYRLYEYTFKNGKGEDVKEKIFLEKRESLTGKDIVRAGVDLARPGHVNVTLSNEGADKMYNLTSRMQLGHDRMAIVLDDVVKSAPTVQAILSKSFEISGLDAPGEAEALTKVLSNPLTNKLNFESASEISASLGHTALLQGEYAGITGLILCFIMMIIYYRFAGLVAIMGLTINALLLLGAMSIFGFELTLPGIAGIVLTLGVAVDANVLIYERLREEKEAGRPFRVAIRNSFDKAFSAIFDSNITSLITAVILYWMATGTIKGFAVTLTVGVITSMIGAILVTRVLFYWADTVGMMKDVKFLNLFKNKSNINFMGQKVWSCSLSAILLLICLAVGAMKGKDCLGMDFTGGSSISYLVNKNEVSFREAESVVNKLALTQKATVQEVAESTDSSKVNILVNFSDNAQDKTAITNALNKAFPVLKDAPFSEETIGQSMGYDTLITSAWALFFGILGIMVYLTVRFEWTFAIGAVIALTHDVLLVLGLVIISGTELNVIHIGALLTVAGYSINDKIIVFDRIREFLRFSDPNESAENIMNEAINQTLSRTLLTSLSTLSVLVCLYFFGGPSMEDFAWTISAGILIGTYSSIFIASPAALLFSRKHGLHAEVKEAMKAGA
ncbi:protein translocase subunit SecD [Akkermansia muciniphila]|uniref:protein translocase subunit SecD n=1 Tax=Akkermansia muciniphila TaxID=239935 RepID=UPI0033ACA947